MGLTITSAVLGTLLPRSIPTQPGPIKGIFKRKEKQSGSEGSSQTWKLTFVVIPLCFVPVGQPCLCIRVSMIWELLHAHKYTSKQKGST